MNTTAHPNQLSAVPRTRVVWGVLLFVVGQTPPMFIPVIARLDLPDAWKTGLSMAMFGLPELFMLAAVAVLGKEGFAYLKGAILGWFKKRVTPPESVAPARYYVGLAMFLSPMLYGWSQPYLSHLIPSLAHHQLLFAIAGDLLLVASLFVLGGDFWDKLRSLFLFRATVHFPGDADVRNQQN